MLLKYHLYFLKRSVSRMVVIISHLFAGALTPSIHIVCVSIGLIVYDISNPGKYILY